MFSWLSLVLWSSPRAGGYLLLLLCTRAVSGASLGPMKPHGVSPEELCAALPLVVAGPWHGQWELLPVFGIAKDGQTVTLSLAGRGDTAHPQGEQGSDGLWRGTRERWLIGLCE